MVQDGTRTLNVVGDDPCTVLITHRDTTDESGHQGELALEYVVHHAHLAAVEAQLPLDIHQQILQSSIPTVGLVATRTVNAPNPARRQHAAVTRSGGRRSRRSVGLPPTAGNDRMATMPPPRGGRVGRVRDQPVPRRGRTP